MLKLGLDIPSRGVIKPSHGGGASFHPKGVRIPDDLTYIYNANFNAPSSSLLSGSFWFKGALGDTDFLGFSGGTPEFDSQNTGSGIFGMTSSADRQISFRLYENTDFTSYFGGSSAVDLVTRGVWHHILYSFNTAHASGSRVQAIYLDDVLVPIDISADVGVAFEITFGGQCDLPSNSSSGFYNGLELAYVWSAPGFTLLNSGAILEANRRLFITDDGKPVDPIGFPAGALLLSGDASTFHTNQGSGGAFTVVGGGFANASSVPWAGHV